MDFFKTGWHFNLQLYFILHEHVISSSSSFRGAFHTHPPFWSDRAKPSWENRTFLYATQPKWYSLLQINSDFEKLNLLELTSLGTIYSSIPRFFSITIFLLCMSLQEGLVFFFFFPLLLEHCIYCSATPGVSLFFPQTAKRLFRGKMSSIQAMKYEKSSLLTLPQLLQAIAWEDSFPSQISLLQNGYTTVYPCLRKRLLKNSRAIK